MTYHWICVRCADGDHPTKPEDAHPDCECDVARCVCKVRL